MNVTQEDSMSKSKDSDSEVDIYADLPNFSADNTISELENAKKNLQTELRALQLKLKEIQAENDKLKKENEALSINISSLYKTAACEIKRKDQMIQELRKEKDAILFRRQRNEAQKHSHRHDVQPAHRYDTQSTEIQVIDDQFPVENDISVIEEKKQYSHNHNADYQHVDDVHYNENEVIATFPEEEDDDDDNAYRVHSKPKEVPNTIFSRRKAQQLQQLVNKCDTLKETTRVDVICDDAVTVIEDCSKTHGTVADGRKNQAVKSHKERDISEVIVEVDIESSSALEPTVFIVKENSSSITLGTKTTDVSYRKTEHLTSKHVSSVRETIEANVKNSSTVQELPSASVKPTQSSRSKSHRKSREHSHTSRSRSEKHSHVSSKDTHSHRKSSANSKFPTHSSSHRSPLKNSSSPMSPKGRSIRETSVSRALKSLRSKSRSRDLNYKSSTSRNEEPAGNEPSKKAESQEHKKSDRATIKAQVSPTFSPQKLQQQSKPLSDTQSRLVPDTTNSVTVPDPKDSSSGDQDIYTRTKNHCEQTHLQQDRLPESKEKEQCSMQTNVVPVGSESCNKSIMEMQAEKILHKEDNSVSGILSENTGEVQGNASELRQDSSDEVMTHVCGPASTSSDASHTEHINQTSDISQKDDIGEHSGPLHNKTISETPTDIDLPLKKRLGDMPVCNSEVIENVPADEQNKDVSEKLLGEIVPHKKGVSEDISLGSLTLAKECNKAPDKYNATLKTILSNIEASVCVADALPEAKNCSSDLLSTEFKTQSENTNSTRRAGVQESETNQDDVIPAGNSEFSNDMHTEENAQSSCHEESRSCENSQNEAIKDKQNCSLEVNKNSKEVEQLDRPIDAAENYQNIVSAILQTSAEERDMMSGVSEKQPVSEERSEDCLLNNKDANPSSQEPVSKSLAIRKEQTKVNQSHPDLNESLSPTTTFKTGNVSFAVVNEPGSFRRRKFKRITSNISNNTDVSDVFRKASDEHVHSEKLTGTKRAYEHLETETSLSPPVKKQALVDPQKDQLHPAAGKDKPVEDSTSQAYLESKRIQADENNCTVTETAASDVKNNTSDLEEGEIEDDSDEKASESNTLNKDMQRPEVVKPIIHAESNIRKEQSRKYLELGRKVRENRRKPHGSHLQEIARGGHDKYHLPNKLFSHCKRRSPSELLIKDRHIKRGIRERVSNSRSRSTSSETSKSTNELDKNERLSYRAKENKFNTKGSHNREETKDKIEFSNIIRSKVDIKGSCNREEKKETKDTAEASNIKKSLLYNVLVNKPKDLSAWIQLGKNSSSEGSHEQSSRKENTATLNGVGREPFKIPAVSSLKLTPVSKYIIKRKKVCNLQDNVSVPVVNISPPKPITSARSENVNENNESVLLKTVATSESGMQVSQQNFIPSRKTNFPSQSKEMVMSKAVPSTSRPRVSQTSVNYSRISAGKSSVRSCKTCLNSQVSSDSSCTSSSSSSSEYENNSDETWNPKRRRRKRTRRNPKTEVTKSKASEINL